MIDNDFSFVFDYDVLESVKRLNLLQNENELTVFKSLGILTITKFSSA